MDQLILHAELCERWSEHLEALRTVVGERCEEHGLPIEEFGWMVNDYVCEPDKDPDHIDFIFQGFHEELAGTWTLGLDGVMCPESSFCLVAWAHSVPAGLILWEP